MGSDSRYMLLRIELEENPSYYDRKFTYIEKKGSFPEPLLPLVEEAYLETM